MKTGIAIMVTLFALSRVTLAQKGEAENGYYPPNYNGTTWTGEVTAINDATREITLTYHKGQKTESFVGVLDEGHKFAVKGGGTHELKVSEIPIGTRLTAYYMEREKKVDGKKVKFNRIFQLKFLPPERKK